MKKILLIALLAILSTTSAYAQRGYGDGGGHGGGWGWGGAWILPALIGGAILYDVTRPPTVYVQPGPVYVQPAPVYAPGYPPVYAAQVAPPSMPNWYFCPTAKAFYPYVTSCPSGWQAVPATPPDALPSGPYGAPPPPR